ncbi:uncharacterized protein LOC134239924 isoform X2 [Saccostrea cucullata]|uniref:uncharacterized protein LOC134239924 isoform X2 n=1 Tax=Saccostrea cuccullata TaxID=36930 RepID=UPI002ED4C2E6
MKRILEEDTKRVHGRDVFADFNVEKRSVDNTAVLDSQALRLSNFNPQRTEDDDEEEKVTEIFYSCESFPHFEYMYRLVRRFAEELKDTVKDSVDCTLFDLKNPQIKINVSGDTSKGNLRQLSKRKGYKDRDGRKCWSPRVNVYFECNSDDVEHDTIHLQFGELSYSNQIVYVEHGCSKIPQISNNFIHFIENKKKSLREAITKCLEEPLFIFLESLKPIFEDSKTFFSKVEESISLMKMLKRWDSSCDKSVYMQQNVMHRVPERIHDNLIRKPGVNAFGCWRNEKFKVFVEEALDQKELEEELQEIDKKFLLSVELQFLAKSIRFQPYLKQGDQIYCDNKITIKSELTSYATLGAMIRNQVSVEDLYILTCGHVFPRLHMCAYGKLNEESAPCKIGSCIFTSLPEQEHFIDFSVVEVSKDVQKYCKVAFMRSENKKCNAIVYTTESFENTLDYVHKNGATSGWTDGRIQCSGFMAKMFGNRKDVFLVLGKGGKFCEPGDSGSIVFAPDNSADQENVHILGMLVGTMHGVNADDNSDFETTPEATKAKDSRAEERPEEVSEGSEGALASLGSFDRRDDDNMRGISPDEFAVCFRLDSALKLLKEKNNLDVEFEKVSISSDEDESD